MTQNKKRKIGRGSQILASVLVNAVYAMLNYPVLVLNAFLAPFSLLLVINFISKGALLGVAIIGGIIMIMITSGIGLQADLSHLKNDFKLQDMIIASETGPVVYLLGMALSELVYSSPALAVLIVLAAIFVHASILGWLTIVVIAAMAFLMSVSAGFLLSNISSDIVQSYGFGSLLSTIFTTITPVYYPITYLPYPYRYFAYLSPTTYIAEIAQSATNLLVFPALTIYIDWVVVVAITAIIFYIAAKRNRWRDV